MGMTKGFPVGMSILDEFPVGKGITEVVVASGHTCAGLRSEREKGLNKMDKTGRRRKGFHISLHNLRWMLKHGIRLRKNHYIRVTCVCTGYGTVHARIPRSVCLENGQQTLK